MNTYTKIPDSILHSKDFDGLNKCRHFALIDLYSLMRNKPGTSFFNRNEFWLNKYQIVKSYANFADRWNVSRNTAKEWLKHFEKCGYIKMDHGNKGTIFTLLIIVDGNKVVRTPVSRHKTDAPTGTLANTQTNTQTNTLAGTLAGTPIYKNEKNGKNERMGENITLTNEVSQFWKAYTNASDPVHPSNVKYIQDALNMKSLDEWQPYIKKMHEKGEMKSIKYFLDDYYTYDPSVSTSKPKKREFDRCGSGSWRAWCSKCKTKLFPDDFQLNKPSECCGQDLLTYEEMKSRTKRQSNPKKNETE